MAYRNSMELDCRQGTDDTNPTEWEYVHRLHCLHWRLSSDVDIFTSAVPPVVSGRIHLARPGIHRFDESPEWARPGTGNLRSRWFRVVSSPSPTHLPPSTSSTTPPALHRGTLQVSAFGVLPVAIALPDLLIPRAGALF